MEIFKSLFYKIVYSRPDFLIIGAPKSGTTSLFHYLSRHKNIIPSEYKEPAFFTWHHDKGYNWYLSKFPNRLKKLNKLTFEATPLYLYFPDTPYKIKKHLPNVKFIVILRNPTERAFSHWNFYNNSEYVNETKYRVENLKDNREFEVAINEELNGIIKSEVHAYLKTGYYLEQIQRYFICFDRSKFLFLDFYDLEHKLPKLMKEVCEFLKIENEFQNVKYDDVTKKYIAVVGKEIKSSEGKNNFSKYNVNKSGNQISDQFYHQLTNHFKTKNKGLGELIGIDFDWN